MNVDAGLATVAATIASFAVGVVAWGFRIEKRTGHIESEVARQGIALENNQVAAHAEADGGVNGRVSLCGTENENARVGIEFDDGTHYVEAALVGQTKIEQHHIGPLLLVHFDGLLPVGGKSGDGHVVPHEHAGESFPDHGVVVDDEDRDVLIFKRGI